jgi:uncharacterized protein YjbI with pentapeptide repeats
VRLAFSAAVVLTVAVLPVLSLLSVQMRFLPYHSFGMTLNHQIVVSLSLVAIWTFWPRVISPAGSWSLRRVVKIQTRIKLGLAVVGTLVVVALSWLLIVLPGMGIERVLGEQRWLNGLLHRHLYLPERTLVRKAPHPEILSAYEIDEEKTVDNAWLDYAEPLLLKRRDLSGADFARTKFWDADFRSTNLVGADLYGANLKNADLGFANLKRAKLQWVRFGGAHLRNANLEAADLSWANFQGADLNPANLKGANLTGASLEGSNLNGASLKGADLTFAKLEGAKLRRADLEGAILVWASLEAANLAYTNLEWADLTNADLSFADLTGVENLETAELGGTDFTGAELTGTFLDINQPPPDVLPAPCNPCSLSRLSPPVSR